MPWGQLVAGPPGSGKTTYCAAMYEYLTHLGRPTIVVNLDFANDTLPYECVINVCDLISVTDAMDTFNLGPNGGLMYCLEYLETNIDWLQEKLQPFMDQGYYCIIDSPGQAELYTHHESLHHIVHTLTKPELFHLQLAAVHLVDCHHCTDAFKFIAAALVSLQAMVRLELPHINILSKVDLKETFQHTGKDLDDFTTDLDLYRILPTLIDDNENESSSLSSSSSSTSSEEGKIRPRFPPRTINYLKKYQKLNERIVEIVTDYNLVSFIPVSIKDPRTLSNAINMIDKATGYVDIKPKITQMKEKRLENQGKEIHQTVSSTASVLSGKILEDDNDEEEIQEDDD